MRRRYIVFAIAALVAVAIDQLSKAWARRVLKPIYPAVKTVIAGFWEMRYSENPGAAFGLLREHPQAQLAFNLVGALLLVGALAYLARAQLKHAIRVPLELGLVVGGALGNMIDRVLFHRVTDFVVWKAGSFEWQTFNFADAALVVGVLALALDGGRQPKGAVAAD
jgi:signal peptidase II